MKWNRTSKVIEIYIWKIGQEMEDDTTNSLKKKKTYRSKIRIALQIDKFDI